ncbi:MAG: ABC transporter substrate-binding protein [Acidimicrobiales bacterium]
MASVLLLVAVLALAGCTSSATRRHASGGVAVYRGGTVYFAARLPPDSIFPFTGPGYFDVQNLNQFQDLMYRPLYWFGQIKSASPSFDEQLSLAFAPTSSNRGTTAVIRLKGWSFSNGQHVDAQSGIFWMNMMMAESANWPGSAAGEFPYNVVGYSAPQGAGGDIVTITFDRAYSATWVLYNELSQITPMPEAWDITSLHGQPGSGRCGVVATGEMDGSATNAACQRVWNFDTDDNETSTHPQMNGDLATYGSNPLWQIVDGPWRLSSYDISSGQATFVPNLDYSGPQQPIVSRFVELFYASEAAKLAAMARGGSATPDVAAIATTDLPANPGAPGTTGGNVSPLARRFNLALSFAWVVEYAPVNFDATASGWIFRQLYVRQALQDLVDQPQLIKTAADGYGVPVYGPVPAYPKSPFLTKQETINPYPFDPSRAVQFLESHGWAIHREGADVCTRAGTGPTDCGKGIREGDKLSFTVIYNNTYFWDTQLVVAETSAWAKAGIQAKPQGEPLMSVFTSLSGSSWQMINWGGGWVFAPDYLPTGDQIFGQGEAANYGGYDDTTAQHLIADTVVSTRLADLYNYENYLAEQLPVVWQPSNDVTAFEISKDLGGVTPMNTLPNLTPEYWYWKTPNHS